MAAVYGAAECNLNGMRTALAVLVLLALVASAGLSGSAAAPATASGEVAPVAPTTANGATSTDDDVTSTDDGDISTAVSVEADDDEATDETAPPALTTEGISFPPGVNESGVEDPSVLVAAHREVLNETGFAFRFRANVSVGDTRQTTVQRGVIEPGLSPLLVRSMSERRVENNTSRVASDIWANDTDTVVRYRRPDETRVHHFNRTGDELGVPDDTWAHLPRADLDSQVTNAWLLELALSLGEFDRVGIENRNGRAVVVLHATKASDANVSEFDASIVVDPRGQVHQLNLTVAYDSEGGPTRASYSLELSELPIGGVERPMWADAALPPEDTASETVTEETATEETTNETKTSNRE